MSRIACILVADFPIAALIRSDSSLVGVPLVISESYAAHAEILFVSEVAFKCGVRTGMTLAQARTMASRLVAMARSSAAERSASEAIADVAESVSPVVEPDENGWAWIDLSGLSRFYESEDAIASELASRVGRIGMEAAVGIAANREIAYLAACCGGIRVIPPRREREFVDWLPLDALNLATRDGGEELATTLARWGLKRLGDLARLDPDALGSRLGRRGIELVRLARGESPRPLHPRRRAEVFTEAVELEYGIETLEPLAFVMRAILDRLADRLELRGLVAGDLLLTLGLVDRRISTRRVVIAAPTNDVRAILTLVNLSLESSRPMRPWIRFALKFRHAHRVPRRPICSCRPHPLQTSWKPLSRGWRPCAGRRTSGCSRPTIRIVPKRSGSIRSNRNRRARQHRATDRRAISRGW